MDRQEFYKRVKNRADSLNMTCKLKEEKRICGSDWSVYVGMDVLIDGYIHSTRYSCIHIQELDGGMCYHWNEEISGNCQHHISGPGYRCYGLYEPPEFKPQPIESVCEDFINSLRNR